MLPVHAELGCDSRIRPALGVQLEDGSDLVVIQLGVAIGRAGQSFWMKPRPVCVAAGQSLRLKSRPVSVATLSRFRVKARTICVAARAHETLPSLCHHVMRVVLVSAKEQVLDGDTWRVIALVQDAEPLGNGAIRKDPGHAMSKLRLSSNTELPIASSQMCRLPLQTRRIHTRPNLDSQLRLCEKPSAASCRHRRIVRLFHLFNLQLDILAARPRESKRAVWLSGVAA